MSPVPKRVLVLCAIFLAAVLVGAGLSRVNAAAPEAAIQLAVKGAANPVVVELFTSQGCSSCPPADGLLAQLGEIDGGRGVIIPLAFHVDYWNRLGWTDPFSDADWTARQQRYATAFRSRTIYTPQMVVQGRAEFVGSDGSAAVDAIEAAARADSAARVTVHDSRFDAETAEWVLAVEAELLEPAEAEELYVLVAVTQSGLRTDVPRGENAGRTLHNDHVVRRLVQAFSVRSTPGSSARQSVAIPLESDWNPRDLRAAVFIQNARTLRIHTATSVPFPATPSSAGAAGL